MQPGLALAPGRRVSDPWTVPLLIGLGVYCVALAGARALLNDGDTLSHIAIGRWILAHRAIPFHDPFTFTARGRSWVPHEWLSELVFAVLYDRLGWGGVVAAAGLSAAAAFVLLTRALAMTLGPRRAAIGALAAFALTESHFLARPHVLAWPLLVVWMAQVIGARDAGRVPSLLLLPIMILWCNLHGGFVVGLFFAGLLAAEAVLAAPAAGRLRAARRMGQVSRSRHARGTRLAERRQWSAAAVQDVRDEVCAGLDLGMAQRRLRRLRSARSMDRAPHSGRVHARDPIAAVAHPDAAAAALGGARPCAQQGASRHRRAASARGPARQTARPRAAVKRE